MSVGAYVAVVVILVLLVLVALVIWKDVDEEKIAERALFDIESNVMIMYPYRHQDHPDFSYECRTLHSKLEDGSYILYRTIRQDKEIQTVSYFISEGRISQEDINEATFDFHDDFDDIKNERWNITYDGEYLSLRPHRMATTIGRKGFTVLDETQYMIGSYVYMDMSDVSGENYWLSHDFGHIPKDKYIHERYHIRFSDGVGIEVYEAINRKTGKSKTYLICEQNNGSKIEIPGVSISHLEEKGMVKIESENPKMYMELMPEVLNEEIGVYKASIIYKNNSEDGTALFERYIP